jgi:hypothetical protein
MSPDINGMNNGAMAGYGFNQLQGQGQGYSNGFNQIQGQGFNSTPFAPSQPSMAMSNPFAMNMQPGLAQPTQSGFAPLPTSIPTSSTATISIATSGNVTLDPFAAHKAVDNSANSFTLENVFGNSTFTNQLNNNAATTQGIASNPFQTSPSASVFGNAANPRLVPEPQVKDPLAGLNPFSKPTVPLAAMQQGTGHMGSANGNLSSQFVSSGLQPQFGLPSSSMTSPTPSGLQFSNSNQFTALNGGSFGSAAPQINTALFASTGPTFNTGAGAGLTSPTSAGFNPFMTQPQQQQQQQPQVRVTFNIRQI